MTEKGKPSEKYRMEADPRINSDFRSISRVQTLFKN